MAQDMENRQVKDVERLDNGNVKITDSEGDVHKGPMGELPGELTSQVVDGFMRQEDYTKKTQKVSELENQVEELRNTVDGLRSGSQSGNQPGQPSQQGNPNAPGGFNGGTASQGSGQSGQPNGTAGNQPSPSGGFESFEPNPENPNNQPNNNMDPDTQKKIDFIFQERMREKKKKEEEARISQLENIHDGFDRDTAEQALRSLPAEQRKELQGLPKDKQLEIAFNRSNPNGSPEGDATSEGQQTPRNNQSGSQQGGEETETPANNTPYAGSGNTTGPTGSPQANNVAYSDDEIVNKINENGLGQQNEEEARNRMAPST